MLVRRNLYDQTAGVLVCHNNFSDSIYQYDINMKPCWKVGVICMLSMKLNSKLYDSIYPALCLYITSKSVSHPLPNDAIWRLLIGWEYAQR